MPPAEGGHLSPALGVLTYNDVTHVYMLNGLRCRSVTNVAKIPTDDYTVNQWRLRMAGIGLASRPDLIEDIAAHVSDNGMVEATMQRAIEHAGADAASRRGTQAHAATEFHDLDQPLLTDQQRRDASIWQRTLDAYGIEIVPEFVESIVVYPDDLIAGRIDRFARYNGRLVDIDIKTGWSAIRYPHGTAVQLALHVAAPFMEARGTTRDGMYEVREWRPVPAELDRDRAYVLRMPTREDGDEIGSLHEYVLTGPHAGHAGRIAAISARHFQLNNQLVRAVEVPVRPAPAGYQYVEASPEPVSGYDPVSGVVILDVERERRRLIERIHSLTDADKASLRAAWTPDLGNVQAPMTAQQVAAAHALVDRHDPFVATIAESMGRHPSNVEPRPALDLPPRPPAEGPQADPADVLALADTHGRLPDSVQAALLALRTEALQAGVDFHLGALNSERRYHLVRGLVTLAVNDALELDVVQGIASFVCGADWPYQPGLTAGQIVGHLDHEQAEQFAATASMLVSGLLALVVDELSRFRFTAVPNTTTTTS